MQSGHLDGSRRKGSPTFGEDPLAESSEQTVPLAQEVSSGTQTGLRMEKRWCFIGRPVRNGPPFRVGQPPAVASICFAPESFRRSRPLGIAWFPTAPPLPSFTIQFCS